MLRYGFGAITDDGASGVDTGASGSCLFEAEPAQPMLEREERDGGRWDGLSGDEGGSDHNDDRDGGRKCVFSGDSDSDHPLETVESALDGGR